MRRSLVIIPSIHILAILAISLNLPYFRQIIVFIYLTFFPGFILLKFLKLTKTKIVDLILFSVGISLAFLMFVGFLINEFLLSAGISRPLSTTPIEIILSTLTFSLYLIGYRRDLFEDLDSWKNNFSDPKVTIIKSMILLLPVLFSIIGATYVSLPSISTLILSLMIIMVAALFVVGGVSLRLIPFKFYPLMIFAISLALAFHILFISGHIIGYDSQLEFQVFNLTVNRGYWTPFPHSINLIVASDYNSMLSLTVLPSIFSVLLNIDGVTLFKTLYPFIFSLVPVVLYRIFEQQIGKASSLLSTLFLISSPLSFYGVEFLSLDRQIVAVFFFVLSVLVLLDKIMPLEKRRILFVVFSAALIVSHYSTAYLYLGFIFFTYTILRITGENNKVLSGKMVLLVSTIGFVWYAFTESPLMTLGNFLNRFFSRFSQDLVSTTSRSTQVFAPHSILTFASAINWVLFFLVHSMILIGVLVVIFKLSKKAKLDTTYRVLLIISSIVLFICIAVPNVAPALNFTRFYQLSLMFLAPSIVLGGHAFVSIFMNLLRRATRKNLLWNTHKIGTALICIVLVGYFFSQSGFINFATKAAPLSYSLDFGRFMESNDVSKKAQIYSAYIPEQNFFSAKWLSEHSQPKSIVYSDYDSLQTALLSYGVLTWERSELHNTTILEQNSYVYLSELNIRDGIITVTEPTAGWFNTSEISSILTQNDLIYSNGNGEIWYVPQSS
jgi:uncharacterized membrane protein